MDSWFLDSWFLTISKIRFLDSWFLDSWICRKSGSGILGFLDLSTNRTGFLVFYPSKANPIKVGGGKLSRLTEIQESKIQEWKSWKIWTPCEVQESKNPRSKNGNLGKSGPPGSSEFTPQGPPVPRKPSRTPLLRVYSPEGMQRSALRTVPSKGEFVEKYSS